MNNEKKLINEVFGADTFILENRVKLYIPTIEQDGTPINQISVDTRVKHFSNRMSETFGGATVTDGYGYWLDDSNQSHTEVVHIITSNASELTSDNLNKLKFYAQVVKEVSNQQAVTIEVNGKMVFI